MRTQTSLVSAKRADEETTRSSRQKKRGNLGTHMRTKTYGSARKDIENGRHEKWMLAQA